MTHGDAPFRRNPSEEDRQENYASIGYEKFARSVGLAVLPRPGFREKIGKQKQIGKTSGAPVDDTAFGCFSGDTAGGSAAHCPELGGVGEGMRLAAWVTRDTGKCGSA